VTFTLKSTEFGWKGTVQRAAITAVIVTMSRLCSKQV